MMRRLWIPPLLIVFLLGLFIVTSHIYTFIQLFFHHAGISITQDEIAQAHTAQQPDARPQLIPKIIHQVFHDWSNGSTGMPADWEETRRTCIQSNSDWEFMLWTEQTSREFIQTHYSWFLRTYDGYSLRIQRIDAVRYFLLLHYGGIYLDLDNGCLRNLTPLLYYPTWITDGGRGALSNNVLGSMPNHPFWQLLTDSLMPYNYNYFFPYITISYASGQWFETAIWQKYHASLPRPTSSKEDNRLHRLMMDDRPSSAPWVFFTQERGGSWVNWDNRLFLLIGDHLILLMLGMAFLAGLIGWVGWRCLTSRNLNGACKGYVPLTDDRDKDDNDTV